MAAWGYRVGLTEVALPRIPRSDGPRICLRTLLHTRPPTSIRAYGYPTASPHQSNGGWWCRNINLLPIAYSFRPRLRYRLTLGGLTLPRKPEALGEGVSHPFYRYSCQHTRFQPVHHASRRRLRSRWNAPLPIPKDPAVSVLSLSPVYCRRMSTRPVSYYAFFKGWLLLSQPPGCLGMSTSFDT